MANLVRIENVYLYVGWTETVADSYAAMKLLNAAGVKYTLMHYADETQHKANQEALSTWVFKSGRKTFTDYPILHWDELYDDYNRYVEGAAGLDEIKTAVEKLKSVPVT